MSIENQIESAMSRLDVTAAFLSSVAGFSQSKVSQGLSRVCPLLNEELLKLVRATNDLEKLAALTAPVPVSFRNPVLIRGLLNQLDEGTLRIRVDSPQVTEKPLAFSIRWRDGRYFDGRKPDGQIVLDLNFVGVLAMTSGVADALLKILSDAGHAGCTKIPQAFAGDVVTEIEKIWPVVPVEDKL